MFGMGKKEDPVQSGPVTASAWSHTAGTVEVEQDSAFATSGQGWTKGTKQEKRCRDPIFAVLFYINIIAISVVAATMGRDALKNAVETDVDADANANAEVDEDNSDYSVFINVAAACGGISVVISGLMFFVLMCIPSILIKTSLIFTIACIAALSAAGFYFGSPVYGGIMLLVLLLNICYAYCVWSRIPFATANLVTACTAIKKNCGVALFSYASVIFAIGWSILWSVAFVGVLDKTQSCTVDSEGIETCDAGGGISFVMLVPFYFTHQVLQNTTHVIVAGVVGTWWFYPSEANCFCSAAIRDSAFRALTTSFGSICFGSLLVAIIQALKEMAHQARQQGSDYPFLLCIAECILGCLESILEYFNKWAFIYVGLYGYGYLEAGKNVMTLFRDRGWSAIIADDLVDNTLFFLSLFTGLLTGCVALLFEDQTDWFDDFTGGNVQVISFVLGLLVGYIVCIIFMSVISSAVNAVIVLFAEGPSEFQQNHPALSEKMRNAWNDAHPGSI